MPCGGMTWQPDGDGAAAQPRAKGARDDRVSGSNWIWILLIGGMLIMHVGHRHRGHAGGGMGGGCGGGQAGHDSGQDHHGGGAGDSHQHGGHPDPGPAPADEALGGRLMSVPAQRHGG